MLRKIYLSREQQETVSCPPWLVLHRESHCVTLDPKRVGKGGMDGGIGDMSKTLLQINCEGFIPGLWQLVAADLLSTIIAVIPRHSYWHGKYHRVLNQHKQQGRETVCI